MITNSLIVFALTLILTKSAIMASKREFVTSRYESARINEDTPSFLHTWFYKMWTCPMCSGFWIAIPVSLIYPINNIIVDVLTIFGLNWLLHCIENLLFFGGEMLKNIDEKNLIGEMIETTQSVQSEIWKIKTNSFKANGS